MRRAQLEKKPPDIVMLCEYGIDDHNDADGVLRSFRFTVLLQLQSL